MEMSLFFFYPEWIGGCIMTKQSQPAESRGVQAIYEWLEALGTAIIIAMILFTFVVRVNEVRGDSMLPNYTEGTRVIVQTLGYQPTAGDVVVIDATHTNLDEFVIKRIIEMCIRDSSRRGPCGNVFRQRVSDPREPDEGVPS